MLSCPSSDGQYSQQCLLFTCTRNIVSATALAGPINRMIRMLYQQKTQLSPTPGHAQFPLDTAILRPDSPQD
jgi:hypothetical protein